MARSFLRMPPFNVVIFVRQTVSPANASTLKGASLHEHGRNVNFDSGGLRFHAEAWPKPLERARHGTRACTRAAHTHAARMSGTPVITQGRCQAQATTPAGTPTNTPTNTLTSDWGYPQWTRRRRSAWRTQSWTRRRRSAWRTRTGRGGRGAPGGRGVGRGGGGAPGGRRAGRG